MPDTYRVRHKMNMRYQREDMLASSLFPPLAFEEEKQLFLCDDHSLGFGFIGSPYPGVDPKMEGRLDTFLRLPFPADTVMQVIFLRSPDIARELMDIQVLRSENRDPKYREYIRSRVDFFGKYCNEKLVTGINGARYDLGHVHQQQCLIIVKSPISGATPNQEELMKMAELRIQAASSLSSMQMPMEALTASLWKRFMNVQLNRGPDAAWRKENVDWNPDEVLSDQVLEYDVGIDVTKDHLKIGDSYCKVLSAKTFPEVVYFGDAIRAVGDLSPASNSIKENYMVCLNILLPDPEKARAAMEKKRQYAVQQASGPMVRFSPDLVQKKEDFDRAYLDVKDGKRILRCSFHVAVFANTERAVEDAAMKARHFYQDARFELMVDRYVQLPILVNMLPLCSDRTAIQQLFRYKTMTSAQAAALMPIFGEWRGTGTPHVNLISRNAQLMSFSLHDTGSNYNCVISAQSGSGKSFLTNELLSSYLSTGAMAWVIDVGYSYEKLCTEFEGDFISFGPESDIGLNPFKPIVSLDGTINTAYPGATDEELSKDEGSEDALVAILKVMAAPEFPLDDFQVAGLKRHLNMVWSKYHRETLIDHMADSLKSDADQRIRDVGEQLFAFTSKGAYGRYFIKNTVNFTNQLNVLELEQLKSRKHMQTVVLLQLINQINQALYMGDPSVHKICVIDEAWDLLSGGGDISKFIETGFRRARKVSGSFVVVTQSVADLYDTKTGRAIAENAATMVMLGQKTEAIDRLKRDNLISLNDGQFDALKGVSTVIGAYSEMFITSQSGLGIARLVVSPFQLLLFSTNPSDKAAVKHYRDQGYNVSDAINMVLRDRSGENSDAA